MAGFQGFYGFPTNNTEDQGEWTHPMTHMAAHRNMYLLHRKSMSKIPFLHPYPTFPDRIEQFLSVQNIHGSASNCLANSLGSLGSLTTYVQLYLCPHAAMPFWLSCSFSLSHASPVSPLLLLSCVLAKTRKFIKPIKAHQSPSSHQTQPSLLTSSPSPFVIHPHPPLS